VRAFVTSRRVWLLAASIALLAVFGADYATGSEVSVSLLYLVPVAAAGWFVGRRAAMVLSAGATASWVAAYLLVRHFLFDPRLLFWNATVEAGVYLTVALTLSALRLEMDKQRATSLELREAYEQLDQELQAVGKIQRRMLPAAPPRPAGWRFAVHYSPSRRAGGDYYDFFPLDQGRIGFLIADASGHGTPAAVMMAMMRALVHTDPAALDAPERALCSANARFAPIILAGQFVTACYVVFERARVDYALAGHVPPLVARAKTGEVEEFVNRSGPPLGLFDKASFAREGARLEPGDTVLLYTDGLTEAMDGSRRFLGVDRVKQVLAEHCLEPEDQLCERLLEELRFHVGRGGLSDDLTLIVARAVPYARS